MHEVASLATQLPQDSALHRALNPHWWRTTEIDFLRSIEHGVRVLAWQQTKDGHRGYDPPAPLSLPWDPEPEGAIKGDEMTWDEAAEYFGWAEAMSRYFPD